MRHLSVCPVTTGQCTSLLQRTQKGTNNRGKSVFEGVNVAVGIAVTRKLDVGMCPWL